MVLTDTLPSSYSTVLPTSVYSPSSRRRTPAEAYRATPVALPAGPRARSHLRLRYDVADKKGVISLRRAGRMHHLKIGAAHARRRVLAIVDEREVTVVDPVSYTHLTLPTMQ